MNPSGPPPPFALRHNPQVPELLYQLLNGIYLVKVITEDNRFTVRKIRKQN